MEEHSIILINIVQKKTYHFIHPGTFPMSFIIIHTQSGDQVICIILGLQLKEICIFKDRNDLSKVTQFIISKSRTEVQVLNTLFETCPSTKLQDTFRTSAYFLTEQERLSFGRIFGC